MRRKDGRKEGLSDPVCCSASLGAADLAFGGKGGRVFAMK